MSKLPTVKSIDIIRILKKIGFEQHRQSGSHKIFKKGNLRVTIPCHSGDLKKGTVHSIIAQSGLTIDEFVKLL